VIAHVGGLPVEEVLPALMSGVGAWLILRLTSLGTRVPSSVPAPGRSGVGRRVGQRHEDAEDGVSFVHVSTADTPDGSNPLPKLAAFQEFGRNSGERVATTPAPTAATVIGYYYGAAQLPELKPPSNRCMPSSSPGPTREHVLKLRPGRWGLPMGRCWPAASTDCRHMMRGTGPRRRH
jgi:hypothetical protein